MPQVPDDSSVTGKGKEEEEDVGPKVASKVPVVIDGHRLTKAERKAMKKATKAMEVAAKLERAKKRMNQVRGIFFIEVITHSLSLSSILFRCTFSSARTVNDTGATPVTMHARASRRLRLPLREKPTKCCIRPLVQ